MVFGPFGVSTDMHVMQGQSGSISMNRAWRVYFSAFLTPVAPNEEVDAISAAVPESVVDEQRSLFDFGVSLFQLIGKLTVGNQQTPCAGFYVHHEDAIVTRCVFMFRPVEAARVSSHRPQSRQSAIVQTEERSAVLGDTTVADGSIIVTVFTDACSFFNVIEHGEYSAGL